MAKTKSMDNLITYVGLISALITISSSAYLAYILKEIKSFETKNVIIILICIVISLIILSLTLLAKIYLNNKNTRAYKIREYFESYIEGNKNYFKDEQHNALVEKTMTSINTLIKKGATKTLESDIYYQYLFSLLSGATRRIWATSIMGEEEWVDSPEECEFLKLNLEASTRKVLVERIFIVKESSIKQMLSTPAVIKQINKRNDYLKVYIVIEEKLRSKKPNLLTDVGSGFLAFDDFAIAIDVFEDSYIRGILSLDIETIDRFNRIFTNLRDFASPLDMEFITEH